MTLERIAVKFFTKTNTVNEAVFIDIFHEWIRFGSVPGILLDVADYRHVPQGPGVMLITHEINYAMDHAEGRFGLVAQQKLSHAATRQELILGLLHAAATFAVRLEYSFRVAGRVQFEAGEFEFYSNDRRLLPNTPAAFADLLPDLQAAAAALYPGRAATISRVDNDPRERLAVRVSAGVPLVMADVESALEAVAH
jgi:hypothetical protein